MTTDLQTVGFAGTELECARVGDDVFVSVKRVCEGLGIDHSAQLRKLNDTHWSTIEHITTVAADGKNRDLAMIDLDTLAMWLATISPAKVSEFARPNVIRYQQECVRVLRRHFFGTPTAEPKRAPIEVETRYPDGRVVVERFAITQQPHTVEVEQLPAPLVDIDEVRRRFNDALNRQLGRADWYLALDARGRGEYRAELNGKMKTIIGRGREQWTAQDYETAAHWLRMHEDIDVRWAVASKEAS